LNQRNAPISRICRQLCTNFGYFGLITLYKESRPYGSRAKRQVAETTECSKERPFEDYRHARPVRLAHHRHPRLVRSVINAALRSPRLFVDYSPKSAPL